MGYLGPGKPTSAPRPCSACLSPWPAGRQRPASQPARDALPVAFVVGAEVGGQRLLLRRDLHPVDHEQEGGHRQQSRPGPTADLLQRLETYYDTAPRALATTEDLGPFTLFVRTDPTGWDFYARPRLGLEPS